jgi:HSP20 family molecular chaperone IbpA
MKPWHGIIPPDNYWYDEIRDFSSNPHEYKPTTIYTFADTLNEVRNWLHNPDSLQFILEMPGFNESHTSIIVDTKQQVLVVEANNELGMRTYKQSFSFPDINSIDFSDIQKSLKDGLLEIAFKKKKQAGEKIIKIL